MMSSLRRLWARLLRQRTAAVEREVDEEIRFHIDMRTASNREAGMEPSAARRAAHRSFGDAQSVRQKGRELLTAARPARQRVKPWISLASDIRFGLRAFRRNPLITAAAIASLALGIGVNTANFSIVYGLLFRPLPFDDGDRLVFMDGWNPLRGDGDSPLTWADLEGIRDSGAFEQTAAFTGRSFTVTGVDQPERVVGASITPNLFPMLGVDPRLGRHFRDDEAADFGFEPVAIISDGLCRRMFAADADILGKSLHLNGRELIVVGVMPPRFGFPLLEDLWLPFGIDDRSDHVRRLAIGLGKLDATVTLDEARTRLAAWSQRTAERYPETHQGWTVRAQWFRHGFLDAPARQALYLMFAAVGFVLLLACANVANLLLAHATDRRRELVVRAALGAGRGRLLAQMLTEGMMLAFAGAALGLLMCRWWLQVGLGSMPEQPSHWMLVALDGTAVAYTLVMSLGTAVVFSLLPALQAGRAGIRDSLNHSGRGVRAGGSRMRSALVIGEVAISVVLLSGATLMMRSFLELQVANPGFEDDHVLSLRVVLAGDRYDDPVARAEYYRQVASRLATAPGVVTAVATGAIPADDGGADVSLLPVGQGVADDEAFYAIAIPSTAGLFSTLGVELLRGRDFTVNEAGDPSAEVAIVGQALAARLWPEADAIGNQVRYVDGNVTYRVIGVAPDVQYEEFGEENDSALLQLHLPYAVAGWRGMGVLVRTSIAPAAAVSAVRAELASLDPTLVPYDILTMPERRDVTTWPQRLFGQSFASFGLIALILALCGVYAVISHSVARRTQEMGVRMALGARPTDVTLTVMFAALRLVGVGIGLGVVAALPMTLAMRGILYGVSAHDPRVFLLVALLLTAAAAVASAIPALRAARVDPTTALRAD